MKKFICCAFAAATLNGYAQDATVRSLKKDAEKTFEKDASDTAARIWKRGAMFSLTVNQGSLSNWSAGGDKFSFSLNGSMNAYAYYKHGRHSWDNSLDLAYGIINTTSLGNRKSSDRIDLTSKYGFGLTRNNGLSLTGLTNVRSQFANGYAYLKNVAGGDSAALTSKSLQPLYLLLSLGLDYKPNNELSLFLSPITARWVIAGDSAIGAIYGVPTGKRSKQELGAYFSATYLKKITENITYKGKLDLFSNYKSHPKNVDVYFSNVITAKIAKYINFSFTFDMIYDDDTKNVNPDKGPQPQILELMGIGFAYKFRNK